VTQAPERPAAPLHSIEDALDALRGSGRRVTRPARQLLDALFAVDEPLAAEELGARAGLESDLSSVYRNLERLQQVGVVSHVHAGHGPGLYALARGRDREYLVCDRCARLTMLEPAELDAIRRRLREDFGHEADFSHFPIHGLCAECQTRG
jgi:Fur family transcriptional regulator, ferric uptake regulator